MLSKPILGYLEQRVTRIGFDNILQRLTGMAVRWEFGAIHYSLGLLTQKWNLTWVSVICSRGEESQYAALTVRFTLGIETLNADEI